MIIITHCKVLLTCYSISKIYLNPSRVSFNCTNLIIAERLSARQLIQLRISFCVCMYVCRSRFGMLILCTLDMGRRVRACSCGTIVWRHVEFQLQLHEVGSEYEYEGIDGCIHRHA